MSRIQANAAKNITTDDDLDQLPGESLLRMAEHLARLEEELRPDSDATPAQLDAWLRVVEQRRRVGETLSKGALERLDIYITERRVQQMSEAWEHADKAWLVSLRNELPAAAHPALDAWAARERPTLARSALLHRDAEHTPTGSPSRAVPGA